MSPYFFVLCIEVLSQLLNSAALTGQNGYLPTCKKLQLTHLSFADDLLIFSDSSQIFLEGIKDVLSDFNKLSGLRVNYSKSEFFCSDTSTRQQLADILGIKVGKFPVSYVGIPLISGKLSVADYKFLTEKMLGLGLDNQISIFC